MVNFFIPPHIVAPIISFDYWYQGLMTHIRSEWITSIILPITHAGDPVVLILLSALLLIILKSRKDAVAVITFAGAMVSGVALVWLLKHLVHRSRPVGGIIPEDGYSFPSGHALMASIFFPLVIFFFKKYIHRIWVKCVFIITCVFLMVAIILSRPYLGVHFISDVLAGLFIGLIISAITMLVTEGYRRKYDLD